MSIDKEHAIANMEVLLAIIILEHHDKNWLAIEYSTNPENLASAKMRLLKQALTLIGKA